MRGFVCGLGAATADMVFCVIAGFGFTFVSKFLEEQALGISIVGACGLVFLGFRIFLSKPVERSCAVTGQDVAHIYVSTFLLTLINPVTILFFVALFTSLGVTLSRLDYPSLILLIAGVLAGAVLWWFLLTGCVSLLHRKLTPGTIRWTNRISGTIVMVLGLLAFLSAVR